MRKSSSSRSGILFMVASLLTFSSCQDMGNTQDRVGPSIGLMAPQIKGTVAGEEFSLEQLRGKKVIIDFWATWCGPCMHEAPELVRIHEANKGQVEVLSIALEKGDPERAIEIAEKLGYSWPYQLVEDINFVRFNDIAKSYGVTNIPATFLIDEEGRILVANKGLKPIEDFLDQRNGS